MSDNAIIQSFWQGPLTEIQQLCIASYLQNGFKIHLYAYENIPNLPKEVEWIDARGVLPKSRIFTYRKGKNRGSIAAFSNLFRYKLLFLCGGWWSDLDMVCLKPFHFPQEMVFCAQRHRNWKMRLLGKTSSDYVNNNIIKCAKGCDVMAYCIKKIESMNLDRIRWGQIGPDLLNHAVRNVFKLDRFAVDYKVFNPIPWFDYRQLFQKEVTLPDTTVAVHLYHSGWRHKERKRALRHDKECLLEKLKKKYL